MLESLNAIIATAAVAMGLSLIVQAIQQITKQWLDLKSNYMRFQLLAMFSAPKHKEPERRFYGLHPITELSADADKRANDIVNELEIAVKSFGYKHLELLEKMSVAEFKKVCETLPVVSRAKDEIRRVRHEVDTWFPITKGAFQDLYERRMKLWSFLIGAATVVVLNANVIEIYREFSTDKVVREAAIAWANRVVSAPADSVLQHQRTAPKEMTSVQANSDQQFRKGIEQHLAEIESVVRAKGFQVLRWRQAERDAFLTGWFSMGWLKNLVKSLFGWFGMTLLVSLGAPFWYDFLKTVMGFKNSFKEQAENKNQKEGG